MLLIGLIFFYLLAFLMGASIGSFIGVLIDRLPRKESIVFPPSHCTNCNHKLKWYENIPVISYIFLGGKCSSCKSKIPFKYFLIEFVFGIIGVLIFSVFFKFKI